MYVVSTYEIRVYMLYTKTFPQKWVRSKTYAKTVKMTRATPNGFILHGAMIVLSLYISSSTGFPASYTRAQCPVGMVDKCRCWQRSLGINRGINVRCELDGASYRRLPVMVNATIRVLTFENATIEEVPRNVFANLSVSIHTFITISTIHSLTKP